jgi:short-subunit dehydrogenase
VACDVCERSAVLEMKAQANAKFGVVSLLFANAGATSFARLTDISDNEVDWMRAVNLDGVTHCLQAFLPDMIKAGAGHVVATASMAGLIPNWVPYHVPYTAAKAGVIGLMLNLRHELSEFGVGCTVLCPGAVTTKIIETPRYRPSRFGGPQNDTIKAPDGFLQAATPEFRSAEEVARMTLLAVKANRPMVVTDATRLELFMDNYAALVRAAFEDAAEFDRQTHC